MESIREAIENLILKHVEELRRLQRINEEMFRIGLQLGKLETYKTYEALERLYWREFDQWSRKSKRMMEIDMKLRPELFAPVYTIPPAGEIEMRLRELKSAMEASEQYTPPQEHICCRIYPSHVENPEIRSNLIELILKILDQLGLYTTEEREERLRSLLRDVLIAISYALEREEVKGMLLDLLRNHPDPQVRGAAAHALSFSTDWDVWEALVDMIWIDDSPRARADCVLALNPDIVESVEILIKVYEFDPSEEVRRCSLIKLSEFTRLDEAIDYLLKVLEGDPLPSNRALAAAALGIGATDIRTEWLPYVKEALRHAKCDEDELVSSIAMISLTYFLQLEIKS